MLEVPNGKKVNHTIHKDLQKEIPAFIHYLINREPVDREQSRQVLTPEQIANKDLERVVRHSRSSLHKEIREVISLYFDENQGVDELLVTPKDLKTQLLGAYNNYELNYIRKVLKSEMGLKMMDLHRYLPLGTAQGTVMGRPFQFLRSNFAEND